MGEVPQSGGIAALNAPAKFGFFPAGKELSEGSFQFLDFRCQRVAVGAPGRAPALRGCVRASFHSPLQRLVNQVILRSSRGVWKGTRMVREVMLPAGHHLKLAGALSEAKPPEIDAKSEVSVGIILVHG